MARLRAAEHLQLPPERPTAAARAAYPGEAAKELRGVWEREESEFGTSHKNAPEYDVFVHWRILARH